MNKIDVEPTAEVIDKAVSELEYAIRDLKNVASKIRSTGDASYAAEAVLVISNIPNSVRLDLLVTRPIREYQRVE